MKKLTVLVVAALAVIIFAQVSQADFTKVLNYQGRLTDSNGIPVADGAQNMIFEICTDSACSSVVYTEAHTSGNAVTVEDGMFSVILGSITSLTLDFDSAAYYIQVSIGATTYTPPQRITAAAMAINVSDNAINSSKVEDNTLTAADLNVNVVSSVDGVTNDGGNIDIVAGDGIVITPNDTANTITITADPTAGGGIDHDSLNNLTWSTAGHTMDADLDMSNNAITNIDWATSDDGAGSLLDADLLDTLNSTQFLRSDTTDDWNGDIRGRLDDNLIVSDGYICVDDNGSTVGACAGTTDGAIYADDFICNAGDCISSDAIPDIYVFNTGDTISGALTVTGTITGGDFVCATAGCIGENEIADGLDTTEIDETVIQQRVTGTCTNDQTAIYSVAQGGTVSCTDKVLYAGTADDLVCTDCIGATEISDIYVLNTGDTMTGALTMSGANIVMGGNDITGFNELTGADTAYPKLVLDSLSTGDNAVEQAASISLGESGTGAAALHLTYTGDGYGHLGMGAIASALPTYEALRFYYTSSTTYFRGLANHGGYRIENVGDPNSGDDAMDRDYADSRYVNDGCTDCLNATEIEDIYVFNSGDTMTGTLNMSGAGIVLNDQNITDVNILQADILQDADSGTEILVQDHLNFASSYQIYNADLIAADADDSYDKIRVWNNADYSIGMKSGQSYGGLSDFAMTFTMSNTPARGFLWRDASDAATDGAMSLTTTGVLTVKSSVTAADFLCNDCIDDTAISDTLGASEIEDIYVFNTGDTMTGALNITMSTGPGLTVLANYNNANVANFTGGASDAYYDWVGFYSGTTRYGIFIWDGAWGECAADQFCITGEQGLDLDSNGTIYMRDIVNMANNRIEGVANPNSGDDAVNVTYANSAYRCEVKTFSVGSTTNCTAGKSVIMAMNASYVLVDVSSMSGSPTTGKMVCCPTIAW